MLISYAMPTPTAIALAGTAGSGWLTADNGSALFDGKPSRKSRVRWASSASPSTGHYVQQDITIPATPVRVCAVLGLVGVPVGTVIHVYGKRPADAGVTWDFGGQNTTTVVQMPDGTCGAWFVLPAGAAAVEKVGFRLYNNASGATWATAATTYDIGEVWAGPAVDAAAAIDWSDDPEDPSKIELTRSGLPRIARRASYRVLDVPLVATGSSEVYGGGLANGMDWMQLRAALSGDARSVLVVRIGPPIVALYGIGRLGSIRHLGGDYFGGQLRHQEIPAQ